MRTSGDCRGSGRGEPASEAERARFPLPLFFFLFRKAGERGRRFERPTSLGSAAYGESRPLPRQKKLDAHRRWAMRAAR